MSTQPQQIDLDEQLRILEKRICELETENTFYKSILNKSKLSSSGSDQNGAMILLNKEQSVPKDSSDSELDIQTSFTWKWNVQTNTVVVPEQYKKVLGYKSNEIGESLNEWDQKIHSDDYPMLMNKRESYIEGSSKNFEFECRIRCKDNSYKWIYTTGKTVEKNNDGLPVLFCAKSIDVSQLKSEQHFNKLFENAPVGTMILNAKGKVLRINRKWCEDTGYRKEEILKTNFSDYLSKTSMEQFTNSFKHLLNSNFSKTCVLEFRHACGDYVRFQFNVSKFEDSQQGALVNCVIQNVTDKLQIEDSLNEHQKRLKLQLNFTNTLIGSMPIPMFYKNIQGYYMGCNSEFELFTGLAENELIGKKASNIWQWEIAKQHQDADKTVVDSQQSYRYDAIVPNAFGQMRNVIVEKALFLDDKDEPAGVLGTFIDITERKQIEEDLQEQSERWQEAQETGKIGHWELNLTTGKLFWSKEAYRIFGLDPDECNPTYDDFLEMIHPEDSSYVSNSYETAVRNKTSCDIIHRIVLKNGEVRYVNEKCKTHYSVQGKAIHSVGTIVDVTELIKKERIIKQQNEELRALNATKDKFFSIIAHDLRSPFSAVLGLSDLALKLLEREQFDQMEHICSLIKDSTQKSFNLLENLLQWSRVQTGRIKFNKERLLLKKIFENVSGFLNVNLDAKKLVLLTEVSNDLFLHADAFMLETILRNLISNAIKYSFKNGTIVLSAFEEADMVQISVMDTGIGIEEKNLGKLFAVERNYTTPGTEDEKGTGLGLILCKEFVDKHGGKIWVESEYEKGTTISFYLPKV